MLSSASTLESFCPRRGWTLVECLVVVAMLGLLMAIAMPAIQSARESARQVQCGNRLRQVGLALQAYGSTQERFPVGCLEWRASGAASHRRQYAWSAFLLPYLEQQALFDAIDFHRPYDALVNRKAAETALPVFQCPSRAVSRSGTAGRSDFGGCFGELINDTRQDDGVFLHERAVAWREITDGLSHTLAVGEDVLGPDNQWINGRNVFVQSHGINDPAAWAFDNEIRGQHRQGAMVLYCDATTRWLSQQTDKQVLGAAITRDGGESAVAIDP